MSLLYRRLQKAKGLSSSKRKEVADSCRDIPRYVREVHICNV
jgi:hypothetical protein